MHRALPKTEAAQWSAACFSLSRLPTQAHGKSTNRLDHQHMASSRESDIKPDEDGVGNSAAVARLRRAIQMASRDGTSPAELKDAARELVAELKNASEPPEQMLLQIKQLLADAGLRPNYTVPSEPNTQTGRDAGIYRDVIAWSIRHYYDGGKSDGGRPPNES